MDYLNYANNIRRPQDTLVKLFPSALLVSHFNDDYTNELEFIKNEPCTKDKDRIPKQSIDTFILDRPELKNIHAFIKLKLKEYATNILGSDTEMVITQSWINKLRQGESHSEHIHPNSIISGVWYPQVHEQSSSIYFLKPVEGVRFSCNVANEFNCVQFSLPVRMGELIMFPSNLMHSVSTHQFEEDRISLSFNTWCKGSLGEIDHLTYLPFDRCV